jgi:hypothetical protein
MSKHVYLGVRCTSPDCGIILRYRYLGIHDEIPTKLPQVPASVELPCDACNTVYTYSSDQMEMFLDDLRQLRSV